jgi:hypothetical protein
MNRDGKVGAQARLPKNVEQRKKKEGKAKYTGMEYDQRFATVARPKKYRHTEGHGVREGSAHERKRRGEGGKRCPSGVGPDLRGNTKDEAQKAELATRVRKRKNGR